MSHNAVTIALCTVVSVIVTNTVISEPPMFSKRIESATAVLGNTVKLQGTLKGSAPIAVKWLKDSELLRDDDPNVKMMFENNITSISFSSVEIKHSGKYTCLAENAAGQQKCEAVLTVQGQNTRSYVREILSNLRCCC